MSVTMLKKVLGALLWLGCPPWLEHLAPPLPAGLNHLTPLVARGH